MKVELLKLLIVALGILPSISNAQCLVVIHTFLALIERKTI